MDKMTFEEFNEALKEVEIDLEYIGLEGILVMISNLLYQRANEFRDYEHASKSYENQARTLSEILRARGYFDDLYEK